MNSTLISVLIVLVVLNLVAMGAVLTFALRRISALSVEITATTAELRKETLAAIQAAVVAMERTTALTTSTEKLVSGDVAHTLALVRQTAGHIESAARGISETAVNVRRLASGAEAIATPANLVAAASRLLQTPSGKAGLLAAAAAAAVRVFAARQRN